MLKKIKAAARGVVVFLLIPVYTTPGIIKSLFSDEFLPLSLRMRKIWCRKSLNVLGVQLNLTGQVPEGGPYIFIGNHRSYLDPIVAMRDIEALPVAKAEVSSWPMIGYGAKVTGIMYVKRESQNSRAATLGAMRTYLKKGFSVLIYPEGTTHTEPQTRPFQRGAFRLAADENIPILPVVIEYEDENDAWVGNDTFLPHFLRSFSKKRTRISIRYGEPILGNDPKELAEVTRHWIDENILDLRRAIDKKEEIQAGA